LHFGASFPRAVQDYGETIRACLPLDFALLGVGEDGHTASLFPHKRYDDGTVVLVDDAPKAPPERMSLSYSSLNSAKTVCFLVSGAAKVDVLEKWQQGESLPVAQVLGKAKTYLLLDVAAARLMPAR
jgi:6-phosphogluconolactonase